MLLAGVYVLNAVSLVLERAGIRASRTLPPTVLALIGGCRWIGRIDFQGGLEASPASRIKAKGPDASDSTITVE